VYCCSASCCSSLRAEISMSDMTTIDGGEGGVWWKVSYSIKGVGCR
jgi:hypothetical protein